MVCGRGLLLEPMNGVFSKSNWINVPEINAQEVIDPEIMRQLNTCRKNGKFA